MRPTQGLDALGTSFCVEADYSTFTQFIYIFSETEIGTGKFCMGSWKQASILFACVDSGI
jgi:hypothetical protein